MNQAHLHGERGVSDEEIRDSIRIMKQQRVTKLVGAIIATLAGIGVLLFVAYLGLTT